MGDGDDDDDNDMGVEDDAFDILAFPAQSNFNGRLYPLTWVNRLTALNASRGRRRRPWRTLVDASAHGFFDLTAHPADLVVLSLYKLAGLPTGLGVLLIRKHCVEPLRRGRRYFGGGTIDALDPNRPGARTLRAAPECFEDGTPPFQECIGALRALDWIRDRHCGWGELRERQQHVAAHFRRMMGMLRHPNGSPLIRILDGPDMESGTRMGKGRRFGPVIAFTMDDAAGSPIGCTTVARLAALWRIHLRSGALCNPGAVGEALGVDLWALAARTGKRCGDGVDVVDGRHVACLRVSIGCVNLARARWGLSRFERFLRSFVEPERGVVEADADAVPRSVSDLPALTVPDKGAFVSQLWIYPVKSCGGFRVKRWEMSASGLRWDRCYAIVDEDGRALSLKSCRALDRVEVIDVDAPTGDIVLRASGVEDLRVLGNGGGDGACVPMSGCGVDDGGVAYDDPAAGDWLERVLGKPCALVRAGDGKAFQNESQVLVVSLRSLAVLRGCREGPTRGDRLDGLGVEKFRANVIIDGLGLDPFEEELWEGGRVELGRQTGAANVSDVE
ncbi:hypothetical protein HK101_000289 [Irineochytrium annulatum]|nr:hypothetical protein HK101_000289 [Irineochytrium annulatum]